MNKQILDSKKDIQNNNNKSQANQQQKRNGKSEEITCEKKHCV